MNRGLLLLQAAAIALVLSALLVLAHRSGGRTYVVYTSIAALLVLEVSILVLWPAREGPAWLSAAALVLPVFASAFVIDVLASREAAAWIQVAAGCAAGFLGYVTAAIVAYTIYMFL